MLAGVGLLLLAVLVFIGWTWRHPSAFEDYGGWGVGNTDWRVGQAAYVGVTFPDDRASGWRGPEQLGSVGMAHVPAEQGGDR